mmetsp:Transcript_47/g.61  ORF Transcript_47/g.61 Transcript_47/m.61 type:complete len:377 (-) Transcript_47:113-1243(-)|eukprot:CAMPEP_0201724346 /NCGR_PEP_ID=MMETSP0593-20130828/8136_1 /ASSEMBLY_ACC=CAM_ASM_000672 /TAXON_ID=267983 /ORGANISM="Skeletonema japonicum, Strain CCMP2506" /LENGTH=376 /DNA_ID=CAMNT_0048215605 /DNA_START=90 /DNA_END=1220 /DNA_ORIENTATION=-
MPSPIFKSLTIGAILFASNASAAIPNWDINFMQVITDFNNNSTDEITLKYEIGMDRDFQVDLFDKGCTEPITGTTIVPTWTTVPKDSNHDYLDIHLDLDKSTITSSNIWNSLFSKIDMCARLRLFSGSNLIKEDARDISIAFDFQIDFTSNEGSLREASLSSGSSTTTVENYVQACTCDDESSFTCNTDTLGPNSLLNICVKSVSSDMEIDFLNTLTMNQGTQEMRIVDGNNLQDPAISSMTMVPEKNGVHVATVIPSIFFSYSGTSNAVVTGVVFLKLKGSRRRLSVNLVGYPKVNAVSHLRIMRADDEKVTEMDPSSAGENDQKSPFTVNIELARDVEVATNSSSSTTMGGMLGFVTVFGFIVVYNIVMCMTIR